MGSEEQRCSGDVVSDIGADKLIMMYQKMLKIRFFEEKVLELHTKVLMPGLAHLYIGEEAVAVGVCENLLADDYITSTHRGHGHCIAKGGDLKRMMAEILGKRTGYCKGKGGSMHIADFGIGILGANGIVGGGIPIATGAALSSKLRGSSQVTVCFFGDGATNTGAFHEGVNLAAAWKLPVVFVCENNLYAISVPQSKHQAVKDVVERALGYGIPGRVVDGTNVIAVYRATRDAVSRARTGEGPTLIECKTYRWTGHHVGDPGNGMRYRTKEEIDRWRERCPIRQLEEVLTSEKIVRPEEMKSIRENISKEVQEAVEFAMESPYPAEEEILADVWA